MARVRVTGFVWSVSVFFMLHGGLMLIAPHQFSYLVSPILKDHLFMMGFTLLSVGVVLLSLHLAIAPAWVDRGAWMISGLLLLGLASTYLGTGIWISAVNYALLGLGMVAAVLIPPEGLTPEPQEQAGHLLLIVAGASSILVGIVLLVTEWEHATEPLFYLTESYNLIFGFFFTAAGALLVTSQMQLSTRWIGRYSPAQGLGFYRLASIFLGVLYLLFLTLTVVPQQLWLAALYYGTYGLLLILHPRYSSRPYIIAPGRMRTRLAFLLIIAAALPLIIGIGVTGRHEENMVRAQALSRQQVLAETLATAGERLLERNRAGLQALAASSGLLDDDASRRTASIQALILAFSPDSSIALYDSFGTLMDNYGEYLYASAPFFEDVQTSLLLKEGVYQPTTQEPPSYAFSMPVLDSKGEFTGLLAVTLPMLGLQEWLEERYLNQPGSVYLLDSKAGIIASIKDVVPERPAVAVDSGTFSGALENSDHSGFFSYTGEDGQEYLVGHARTTNGGLVVVVEEPVSSALAGVYSGRNIAFGVLLIFLLAASITGVVLSNHITMPLTQLSRAVAEFGEGEISIPLPRSGFQEIQKLVASFSLLRARLAARTTEREKALRELEVAREELELRVTERTEDLSRATEELLRVNRELSQLNVDLERELEERLRVEKELRQSEERFRLMGETVPYGVWLCDAEGKAIYTSPSFLDLLGLTLEEARESGWVKRLPPETQKATLDSWMEAVRLGEDWTSENKFFGADGKYHTVLTRGKPVYDENGEIICWVGINLDIDDRKKAEQELAAYAVRLEQVNRDLQDFAFVASHDLQEPLRKILSFSNLISVDELQDRKVADYIQRMHSAAQRMKRLMDDLLQYAGVDQRGQPFERANLDVIVNEVVEDLSLRMRETAGDVQLAPLGMIEGDPVQIRQLLQNLIGNSLKFSHPGRPPVVRVWAEREDNLEGDKGYTSGDFGKITIYVEDNGIGFDERYAERLFQPFQRLHGRGEYEGTGVGLAICRKVVNRHGGTIRAKSSDGEGSTFIVELPLRQEPSQERMLFP